MSRTRSGLSPQARYRFCGKTGTVGSLFLKGWIDAHEIQVVAALKNVGDSVALLRHTKAYQCTRIR